MSRTDTTLLEQMRISDVEIDHRMKLLGLDRESLVQLSGFKSIVEQSIDLIVSEFYQKQIEIDDIALLIGDADTLRRLRAAQRRYIIDLFSGHYDSEYVNNRLRIGMVHKRIGVEPKLYLSAVRTLKEIVVRVLTDNIQKDSTLCKTLDTLDKLLYFDTTLVFDTYIGSLVGEIETAKKRTEIYAKSLEEKVAERTRQLEEQAKLDSLTNIYNPRAMQELLRRELSVAKRRQSILSVVYFDIDKFKDINDTCGHIKGDEVLKVVGQMLRDNVREGDIPCRYGGDEFCLILPECEIDKAKEVCEKMINLFTCQFPDYSLSFGIAQTGPCEFLDEEQLIRNADENMYLAKKDSGCQIRF